MQASCVGCFARQQHFEAAGVVIREGELGAALDFRFDGRVQLDRAGCFWDVDFVLAGIENLVETEARAQAQLQARIERVVKVVAGAQVGDRVGVQG